MIILEFDFVYRAPFFACFFFLRSERYPDRFGTTLKECRSVRPLSDSLSTIFATRWTLHTELCSSWLNFACVVGARTETGPFMILRLKIHCLFISLNVSWTFLSKHAKSYMFSDQTRWLRTDPKLCLHKCFTPNRHWDKRADNIENHHALWFNS